MLAKTNFIKNTATSLLTQGKTITFDQLATLLNSNGFTTEYGSSFSGGRGVAKLVHSVWDRLNAQGMIAERDAVAASFTNAVGDYAY